MVNNSMTKSRLFLTLALSMAGVFPFSISCQAMESVEQSELERVRQANTIATSFINVLPIESQSSIGLKVKSHLREGINAGYTEEVTQKYTNLYKALEEQESTLALNPFLKKEMALVKSIVANTLDLLRLNKKYGRLTIFLPFNHCNTNDAIDAVSYIFDALSSQVIQKDPLPVIGQRFESYVKGDEINPPFIEGVEREMRHLLHIYQGQSIAYPCLKQIEEILDPERLKTVLKWISENIPQEYNELLPLFEKQISGYEKFVREELLPHAPKEASLPEEIYLTLLKLHGVHDAPEELIKKAQEDFKGLYAEYEKIAKEVAEDEKLEFTDPVKVLQYLEETKTLKDPQMVMDLYKSIQGEIEEWITKGQLMTLPEKPITTRLGNEAEEAIMPVPHVNTPYFVDNDGSIQPEFVLCDLKSHGNPLVAYPLAVHEGSPGHVLQFARMLEAYLKGELDLIQAVVASNSTNCEGWAHYTEYLMRPYYDKGAQLGAIRDQLLRSARLFLDPQLNLGRITFEDVVKFYTEKVGFTMEVAKSEAERYSYRMPAQATTYRYGSLKIAEARDQLERELQDRFTLKKFHDTFVSFGLLPISLTFNDIKAKMSQTPNLK